MRVLVDGMKEEMVEEPYMRRAVGRESAVVLQIEKESLPLPTKALRNVVPQPLDPCIVYAPVRGCLSESAEKGAHLRSPDVRSATDAAVRLHPFCDPLSWVHAASLDDLHD